MLERESRPPRPPGGDEDESDEVLARRVQDGDRDAFGALVRRYLRSIHGVAAAHLDDPAEVEDAAQDAFLRALDRIGSYDPSRPFAPWLYQVARNVARNRRTSGRRRPEVPLDGIEDVRPDDAPSPEERVERLELRRRLDAAIRRLPDAQREAFRLFDVEGFPAARIARLMGIAEGTVRSHVFHARRALRARLGDRGPEER